MRQTDIEALCEGALRASKLDLEKPHRPEQLARRMVGPVIKLPARGLPPHAFLARVDTDLRICIRGELPPQQLAWSLLHETAEAVLARAQYREADTEEVANRLAASLRAPRPFAERACRDIGPDKWKQLALAFDSTESSAALRFGEVTGEPIMLVTPTLKRERGKQFEWPANVRRSRPGIVRAALRDGPGRYVLRAG